MWRFFLHTRVAMQWALNVEELRGLHADLKSPFRSYPLSTDYPAQVIQLLVVIFLESEVKCAVRKMLGAF
jgi:hypothetical protein